MTPFSIPTFTLSGELINDAPIKAVTLFKLCGLCKSINEARNIASQKGLFIDNLVVEPDDLFWFTDFPCLLRRGKKQFCQVAIGS